MGDDRCRPDRCEHLGRYWSVTVSTTWQVIHLPDRRDTADPAAFARFHQAIDAGGTIRPATPKDRDTWAELVHTEAQLRQARNVNERRAIMCPPTATDRPLF